MPRLSGSHFGGRRRHGFAGTPLWTWLATVAALTLPGPGDDAVYAAQWQVLLLIVVGSIPPLMLLYRSNHPR